MRSRANLLAAVVAACTVSVGCGEGAPSVPVSMPYPGAIVAGDVGEGLKEYPTPAESLFVYEASDLTGDVELVFHRGRGTARDGDGRTYVPDPGGSRILVVGEEATVTAIAGGPGDDDGGLIQPLSAAPTSTGGLFVTDAETDPGLFWFDDGEYAGAAAPPVEFGEIRAGPDGALWAARSPYVLRFDETMPGEPLLYRFDPLAGEGVGIAAIEPVADPSWNRVANAGPIAVGEDGTAYFSFFLRNELRAYAPAGELLWRTKRGLIWEENAGGGGPMRPVTQAIALGPDGLLYGLSVPDTLPELSAEVTPSRGGRRVEVYDPTTGVFLRAATVPAAWTTFAVDRFGVVYHVDPAAVEATAPPPERRPLPRVVLAGFDGEEATFDRWAGKALLVNFWASWCVPCQREIPQLIRYYDELDTAHVEFIGVSADETRGAALAFIEPFDVPFPQFYGGLGMQEDFGFFGLPYTIVVDHHGRIVEEVFGFGNEENWRYLQGVLEEEVERARAAALAAAAATHATHGEPGPGGPG